MGDRIDAFVSRLGETSKAWHQNECHGEFLAMQRMISTGMLLVAVSLTTVFHDMMYSTVVQYNDWNWTTGQPIYCAILSRRIFRSSYRYTYYMFHILEQREPLRRKRWVYGAYVQEEIVAYPSIEHYYAATGFLLLQSPITKDTARSKLWTEHTCPTRPNASIIDSSKVRFDFPKHSWRGADCSIFIISRLAHLTP